MFTSFKQGQNLTEGWKVRWKILCENSCEPWNVLVFQVRGEAFSELEACIAKMCLDGTFAPSYLFCNGFDRHFMNII